VHLLEFAPPNKHNQKCKYRPGHKHCNAENPNYSLGTVEFAKLDKLDSFLQCRTEPASRPNFI
jgi:hypothetical protein